MREEQREALEKVLWQGWWKSPKRDRPRLLVRNHGWWQQIKDLRQQEIFYLRGRLHETAQEVTRETDTRTYLVAAYLLALASWPLEGHQDPIAGPTLGHALAHTPPLKKLGSGNRPQAEAHVQQVIAHRARTEEILHTVTGAVRHCWRLGQPVHLANTAPLLVQLIDPSDGVHYQATLRIAKDYQHTLHTRRKGAA